MLGAASRHGLALLQALSHYPYRVTGHGTLPVRQYLEAGFQQGDWVKPEAPFTVMFHNYLKEFTTLFREDPALFAMSASGEGDIAAGPARVNDTYRYVKEHDPHHLFVAEPIFRLTQLPHRHCTGWEPPLAGSRMYWMGTFIEPEVDLSIEFKLLQLGDYFMGEGSWPCPPLYARFMGYPGTWAGTDRYRTRVRDSLYLGLVHRCPFMLTWDEQHTEDERIVLKQVREMVNWDQDFLPAPVVLRVDDHCAVTDLRDESLREGRLILAQYERYFAGLPLATRYVPVDQDVPRDVSLTIDARLPFAEPAADLQAHMPLRVSTGYRASYLQSADRATLLCYICNCTHHVSIKGNSLEGLFHRLPKPVPLEIAVANSAGRTLVCRFFDLNDKTCVREIKLTREERLVLPDTDHDFLLVTVPG